MRSGIGKAVGIVVVGSLIGCSKGSSREEEWAEVAKMIPWTMPMLTTCAAYENAQSDLDKNDLAKAAQNTFRTATVTSVKGMVETVAPGGAGMTDEYVLQISVGREFRFSSQSGKRPIKRGDAIYDRVAKLAKGQCVLFSAVRLEPLSPFVRGKVCDPVFIARFTALEPCP